MSDNNGLTGTQYARKAREAAVTLGKQNRFVTIENVRAVVGEPPAHVDPRVMGTVFRGKDWEKVDAVVAERGAARNRKIAQFEYVGNAA